MLFWFATSLTWALEIYLAAGLLFAIAFVLFGVQRIDPAAREGTWGFRLLILPGTAALWPLMLWRCVRRLPPPEERSAHRRAAKARSAGGSK